MCLIVTVLAQDHFYSDLLSSSHSEFVTECPAMTNRCCLSVWWYRAFRSGRCLRGNMYEQCDRLWVCLGVVYSLCSLRCKRGLVYSMRCDLCCPRSLRVVRLAPRLALWVIEFCARPRPESQKQYVVCCRGSLSARWSTRAIDAYPAIMGILAEGAITLSVTLSGGVLFASWKLLQFLSSLIVKVILAIFSRASAQQAREFCHRTFVRLLASCLRCVAACSITRSALPTLGYGLSKWSFRVWAQASCAWCLVWSWCSTNTRGGTRAHNLLLRREAPYPLGHTGDCAKEVLHLHLISIPRRCACVCLETAPRMFVDVWELMLCYSATHAPL